MDEDIKELLQKILNEIIKINKKLDDSSNNKELSEDEIKKMQEENGKAAMEMGEMLRQINQ